MTIILPQRELSLMPWSSCVFGTQCNRKDDQYGTMTAGAIHFAPVD
jgi:hypothetical protein